MKKICFCAEIHIPHSQPRNTPYDIFFNNHNTYNPAEERMVKKIVSENLLPFFHCLDTINKKNRQKIKIGISISGIALKMLQKYAPEVIGQMTHLKIDKSIELLSQPWGHSVTAYYNVKSLKRQVKLHDKVMQSYFGEVPQTFYLNSPVYNNKSVSTIFSLGKNAVFTNTNYLDEVVFEAFFSDHETAPKQLLFPVDNKMSKFIQNLDFNLLQQNTPYHTKGVIRQFKKNTSDNFPVIINCNLTRTKCFFHLSRSLTWEKLLREMLNDPDIEFIAPSETLKDQNYSDWENTISQMVERGKIPDLWLKNSFQQRAFEKQLMIDKRIDEESPETLTSEWDYLQDMDYLYFMNDYFSQKNYAATHFSPYSNPVKAFNSYIETLNRFTARLSNHEKTGFLNRKVFVNLNEGKIKRYPTAY